MLRVSGTGVQAAASRISIKPFRVSAGAIHFDVSKAGFDDLPTQTNDATAFLRAHMTDLKFLLAERGASGVLDFAIEQRDVAAQFDTFPAELVREAGSLGLALELSHYPAASERGPEA